MYYYKQGSTYIASQSEVSGAVAVPEEEYDRVKAIVNQRPTPPDSYGYRLTADLKWELYELPPEEQSEEATAEDYQSALSELGVIV